MAWLEFCRPYASADVMSAMNVTSRGVMGYQGESTWVPGGSGLLVCQYAVPIQMAASVHRIARFHTRERRVAGTSRIVEVNGMD